MRHSASATGIPEVLEFCWMPGVNQLRNPAVGDFRMPRAHASRDVEARSARHIQSNVRANWLLQRWLSGTTFARIVDTDPRFATTDALRTLEASLFMVGYDLRGNRDYPAARPRPEPQPLLAEDAP